MPKDIESPCESCGNASTHSDSEGVPLCAECHASLEEDSRKELAAALAVPTVSDAASEYLQGLIYGGALVGQQNEEFVRTSFLAGAEWALKRLADARFEAVQVCIGGEVKTLDILVQDAERLQLILDRTKPL